MNKNITTVYQHFDKRGVLLYVGISNDPKRRLREHRDKRWFKLIYKIKQNEFKSRKLALAEEERLIKNRKPIYNKIHNGKGSVASYLTVRYLTEIERVLYIILVGYLII